MKHEDPIFLEEFGLLFEKVLLPFRVLVESFFAHLKHCLEFFFRKISLTKFNSTKVNACDISDDLVKRRTQSD